MQDLQGLLSLHGEVHSGWLLWQGVREEIQIARDFAMGLVWNRGWTTNQHIFELLINLNKFEELQDLLSLHREVHSGWLLWQGVRKEI